MKIDEKDFISGLWNKAKSLWVKWVHRNLSENHCEECLKLDGCYFLKEKTPKHPHHPYCHCILEAISYNTVLKKAKAVSAYQKFDPYLFDPEYNKKHGKAKMLESWGYTVKDSKYLQEESEKQALKKYTVGDYKLGLLNEYGQRISIRISIPRKDTGEMVSYITGWMVYPNGEIRLTTPYGGK